MKILSIDIGGTAIKYALMDSESMEFLDKGSFPTPQSGRQEFVQAIGELYNRYSEAEGVTISMPGIIDSEKGYCSLGGALRYNDDFYIRDALAEKIPIPIILNNDAKCAAMAEATVGSLRDASEGMVLLFGTMIGGGIIHDHKLLFGRHFSAGEVSYILPNTNCPVTGDNVWGNVNGTPRLCRLYADRKGIDATTVNGRVVFDSYHKGDEDARAALDEYTYGIAVQIYNLQNILDLEKFAIGGGISAQPVFIETIKSQLERIYEASPYVVPHAEVVTCKFGNDANLIGALQFYIADRNQTS